MPFAFREPRENRGTSVVSAPRLVGACPHRARASLARVIALAVAASLACGACANTDDNQVSQPSVVGMSDKLGASYADGELTLFEVQTPVRLPFRKPTDQEKSALGKQAPFPRAPFHLASEARVKIAWTITNLDDKEHAVELLVDPWNEFIRYHPTVQVVNADVTTPDYSGFDKFVIVPPKSRVQGELTPDDVVELAVDLATAQIVMSKAGNDPNVDANALINHAFNLQNRSNQPDPLIAPYLPAGAVPGVIGFDLGLRFTATDTQQTAPNVAVEALVDVEDLQGDRVTPPGDTSNQLNVPSRELVPPKPSTMN